MLSQAAGVPWRRPDELLTSARERLHENLAAFAEADLEDVRNRYARAHGGSANRIHYGDQQQYFGHELLDSDDWAAAPAAPTLVPPEPGRDPWHGLTAAEDAQAAPFAAAGALGTGTFHEPSGGAQQRFQPRAASTPPEHLNPSVVHGASSAASARRVAQTSAWSGASRSPQRRCLTPTPASPPRHHAQPQPDANAAAAAISKLLHTEEIIDHHAAILDRNFSPGLLTRERELGNRLGWQAASGVLGRARLMHSKGAVPSNLALKRMAAAVQGGGRGASGAGGAPGASTWMEQQGHGRAEHGSAEWVARAAVLTTQARPRASATAKAAAVAARSRFDKGQLLHLIVNNAEPAAVVAAAAGLVRGSHAGAAAAAAAAPHDGKNGCSGAAACGPALTGSEPSAQRGVSFAGEAVAGDRDGEGEGGSGGGSSDDDTVELSVEDAGAPWEATACAGVLMERLRACSYSHGDGQAGAATGGRGVTELERLRRRSIGELPLLMGLRRSSQGVSLGSLSNAGGGPSSYGGTTSHGDSNSNSGSGFGEVGSVPAVLDESILALPNSPHSAAKKNDAGCYGGAFPPPPIPRPPRGGSGVHAVLSPAPLSSSGAAAVSAVAAGANNSSSGAQSAFGCGSPSLLRPSGTGSLHPSLSNSHRQPPAVSMFSLPAGSAAAASLGERAASPCQHCELSPLSASRLVPTGAGSATACMASMPRRDMFASMAAAASASASAASRDSGVADDCGRAVYTVGGGDGDGSNSNRSVPHTDDSEVLLLGANSAPVPNPCAARLHTIARRLPSRMASSGSCITTTPRHQQQQPQRPGTATVAVAAAGAAAAAAAPAPPEDGSYPRWDGLYQMQRLTENYHRRRLGTTSPSRSPSQSPLPGARAAATATTTAADATANGSGGSRRRTMDTGEWAAARPRARLSGGMPYLSETGEASGRRPYSVRSSAADVSDKVSEGGSEGEGEAEGEGEEEPAGGWKAPSSRPATPSVELVAAAAHANAGSGSGGATGIQAVVSQVWGGAVLRGFG